MVCLRWLCSIQLSCVDKSVADWQRLSFLDWLLFHLFFLSSSLIQAREIPRPLAAACLACLTIGSRCWEGIALSILLGQRLLVCWAVAAARQRRTPVAGALSPLVALSIAKLDNVCLFFCYSSFGHLPTIANKVLADGSNLIDQCADTRLDRLSVSRFQAFCPKRDQKSSFAAADSSDM